MLPVLWLSLLSVSVMRSSCGRDAEIEDEARALDGRERDLVGSRPLDQADLALGDAVENSDDDAPLGETTVRGVLPFERTTLYFCLVALEPREVVLSA